MAATPEKVNFPFDAALPAARALWSLSQSLYNEVEPARQRAATTAVQGFAGTFADQFVTRMQTSAANATTTANDLRAAAVNIARAWADAEHQQQLYNYFAMVKDKRDNRSLMQEAGDWVSGDNADYGKQPDPPWCRRLPGSPRQPCPRPPCRESPSPRAEIRLDLSGPDPDVMWRRRGRGPAPIQPDDDVFVIDAELTWYENGAQRGFWAFVDPEWRAWVERDDPRPPETLRACYPRGILPPQPNRNDRLLFIIGATSSIEGYIGATPDQLQEWLGDRRPVEVLPAVADEAPAWTFE